MASSRVGARTSTRGEGVPLLPPEDGALLFVAMSAAAAVRGDGGSWSYRGRRLGLLMGGYTGTIPVRYIIHTQYKYNMYKHIRQGPVYLFIYLLR